MSEIRATTISDSAGTGPIALTKQSASKAWSFHNHDGTNYDSVNVSSVTDVSVGLTRLTWTNAFSNANYACAGAHDDGSGSDESRMAGFHSKSTTVVSEYIYTSSGSLSDQPRSGVFHGDLA